MRERPSDIDWEEKLAGARVDLDALWNEEILLQEQAVGDSASERVFDMLFEKPAMENEHEPLRIVPVKNISTLDEETQSPLIRQKTHMFSSAIWKLVMSHCEQHDNSLSGLKVPLLLEQIRTQIREALPQDPDSQLFYEKSLREGANCVFVTLSAHITKAIVTSLSAGNREAALLGAQKEFREGRFQQIASHTPSEEKILNAYVDDIVYEIFEADRI